MASRKVVGGVWEVIAEDLEVSASASKLKMSIGDPGERGHARAPERHCGWDVARTGRTQVAGW